MRSGTEEYNQGLSERRADSIKRYLTDQIRHRQCRSVTVGYGKSKPEGSEARRPTRSTAAFRSSTWTARPRRIGQLRLPPAGVRQADLRMDATMVQVG